MIRVVLVSILNVCVMLSAEISFAQSTETAQPSETEAKQIQQASQKYNFPGGIVELHTKKTGPRMPTVTYGLAEPIIIEHSDYWKILIGIDLETIPGQYVTYVKQADSDEPAYSLQFEIQHRGYPAVTVDSLPEFIASPDKLSDIDFVNSAEPQLPLQLPAKGVWDNYFGHVMITPAKKNKGEQSFAIQQYMSLLDVQNSTVVIAPQDGVISRIVQSKDKQRYIVYIDHGRGLYSIVCGLSQLAIELGDGVINGAVIGKFDSKLPNSDNTKTINLRWQVVINGVFVDPAILTQITKTNTD